MKKFVAILLVACLALSLCACASVDKFKERLSAASYIIQTNVAKDMEEAAEDYDCNIDDYEIQSAFCATHQFKGTSVYVVECGSRACAKDLCDDLQPLVVDLIDEYDGYYSFTATTKGKIVLIGEVTAVNDALGK